MTTKNKIHAALAISEFWAIHSQFAENALAAMAEVPAELMAGNPTQQDDYTGAVNGDFIVRVQGTMMKGESSWGDSCSTVKTRRLIRAAAADPRCDRIIVAFDSPGGTVEGTGELVDDIRKAASKKPIIAYIEDTCASAALWAAAACSEIVSSPHANSIGSIGIYTVYFDRSEQAARNGVTPVLISSGGVKGQPTSGLPLSAEFMEYAQERVLKMFESFCTSVADDRGMEYERVLSIADGRVFTAQEALGLGLVDKLMSWDDLFSQEVKKAHSVKAEASEAEGNMKFLDKFKNKAPDTAAVETPKTPQSEAVGHDLEAIDAVVQSAVAGIVTAKVDKFIDTGLLTAASRDAATELLLAAIESDGLELEGNGALKPGRFQSAVVAFIEGLPKADVSTPGLAAVDGGRSVLVEEDRFKSRADEYRALAEDQTPGMKKVKK